MTPKTGPAQPRTSSLACLRFPKWIHAFAWGGILALVLLLMAVARHYEGKNFWNGWTESRELRHPGYMERIYPGDFLRTRANAWSNLAYVLVGFYAMGLGYHDSRRKPPADAGYLVNTPAMSFLFGAMSCYLGFGSGFYHASLTRLGQQVDVAAMYAPLLALIAINIGRWLVAGKLSGRQKDFPIWPILAALVLSASYLLFKYKWSMSSAKVLPALILTVTAFALLDRFQRRHKLSVLLMLFSAVALVSARVCWQLDVAKTFSGPDTWLQGHSVWHLLTALSTGCMYFYYRSEVILEN